MSESSWNRRRDAGETMSSASATASARKLVGALWQHNKGGAFQEEEEIGWDAAAARRSSDHRRSASVELSKMPRRKSNLKDDGERSWHNGRAHGHWFSDAVSNGGAVEASPCRQGLSSPCPVGRTAQLQQLYNSLTASNELVRVLANVCAPGVLNPTAASLLAALRSELDVARARARQLVRQQRRRGDDDESVELVREQLAEEVRAWKNRHREKAAAAARLVASELDGERRSRRRAERVSKKLGEALAEAEASLREATRELERERRSRERLEKACDELAGSGGGRAEAEEELRREAESVLEELEREREMMQVADEMREERVRMKLAEARLQFEEKNAVVDRLRHELESFLGTTTTTKDLQQSPVRDEHYHAVGDDRRLQLALASELVVDGIDRVVTDRNGDDRNDNDGDQRGGVDADDSEGSDIELNLNMDDHSKDYCWTYSTASKETTAKNAASAHGSLSDRATEYGAGTFDRRSQGLGDAPEQEWDEEGRSDEDDDDERTTTKDMDEDAERYQAIKTLREQMLAGHGFVFLSSQGGPDATDGDQHLHGLVPQIQNGGLW